MIEVVHPWLYEWAGDAKGDDNPKPYIEVVSSPNNLDEAIRGFATTSATEGKLTHELSYYSHSIPPLLMSMMLWYSHYRNAVAMVVNIR